MSKKLRRRKSPPKLLTHARGNAFVRVKGKDISLGRAGTPEAQANYAGVVALWHRSRGDLDPELVRGVRRGPRVASPPGSTESVTVDELIERYVHEHVRVHYRKHVEPTSEQEIQGLAVRFLHEGYGLICVEEFGPLMLRECRERMIDEGLARSTVNGYVARIRQAFRWGVEFGIVEPMVLHGLQAVRGLRQGRSRARETDPVRSVPQEAVDAVLPHLPAQVGAMVRIQLLTAMRPGEVVQMRSGSIDRSGPVWLYRPDSHKNEHHGIDRVVQMGPRAQDVVRPWLRLDPSVPLFSPAEAEASRNANRRTKRETKRWRSHGPERRRERRGQEPRELADMYDVTNYRRAIERVVLHENRARLVKCPGMDDARKLAGSEWRALRIERGIRAVDLRLQKLGRAIESVTPWSPNLLRHTAATLIRH